MGIMAGLAVGLMVGLVLVVVLLKFANKDKKVKTEYDERQQTIKNKGYVIGFYSMVTALAIEALWSITGYGFPLPDFAMYFATIMIGVTVMGGYAIWNGVYWGMNNDPKRYAIIFAIAIVLNLIPVIGGIARGDFLGNNTVDSLPILNIMVLIMFVVLLVIMLIKYLVDKLDREED